MFAREEQVAVTYLTWKWTWLAMAISLMFLVGGSLGAGLGEGLSEANYHGLGVVALGLPIMMGIPLLLSVVKWQFCNPRAQLLPGFARAHLTVMGCWMAAALLIGPILYSLASGASLLGSLAYALLAGGLVFSGGVRNRGGEMLPAVVVLFSGYGDFGARLWWAPVGSYATLNVVAACFGAGLIAYRTIQLVRLDEEDDAYQVVPMGGSFSASRMVRGEQRKLVGRWIDRNR